MKNITIFIILGLFLISMTTMQTLTSRSKQQVVLHSNDINVLSKLINKYYTLGYRATLGVGQGISNRATIDAAYADGEQLRKGEILVIMEK